MDGLLVLLLAVLFVLFLYFYFTIDDVDILPFLKSIIGLMIILFPTSIYISIKRFIRNKPKAIISQEGVELPLAGVDLIPWKDVKMIYRHSWILHFSRVYEFHVLDPQKYISHLSAFTKRIYKVTPTNGFRIFVTKEQEKELISYLEKLNLLHLIKKKYI